MDIKVTLSQEIVVQTRPSSEKKELASSLTVIEKNLTIDPSSNIVVKLALHVSVVHVNNFVANGTLFVCFIAKHVKISIIKTTITSTIKIILLSKLKLSWLIIKFAAMFVHLNI
jgi:hypothetical protein